MKKLLFILFSMCFITAINAQTDTQNAKIENIQFGQIEHDFGTIQQSDTPVVYEFEYTNAGNEYLLIASAVASCGCTVVDYLKDPLQPGKKGTIKVSYSTKNRPGAFRKNINISTNYGTRTLTIKGIVENN